MSDVCFEISQLLSWKFNVLKSHHIAYEPSFSTNFLVHCVFRSGLCCLMSFDKISRYMYDVVKKIYNSGLGYNLSFICTSVFLYANDILLLSPSVRALQAMLLICEQELLSLDLCLNHNKSVCIRVGPCFNAGPLS